MGRIVVAVACVLVACVHMDPARHARISDAVAMEGCDYLGDFVGTGSDRPGGSQRFGLQWNAAEAGATDVVFYSNSRSVLVAKGYRCPSSAYGSQDAGDADIAE